MILFTLLSTIFAFAQSEAGSAQLIPVRVDFVEALAPKDTTSSTRYRESYEGTISVAAELLSKKLKSCGYVLDTHTAFYDASDSLKAKEFGEKSAQEGAWLVVGPRRSNHYLLLVQGVGSVPTVSIMASSDKVGELGLRNTTVAPMNSQMAQAAVKEVKKRKKNSYISVVSSDCSNCVDFSKSFDEAALKAGLKKVNEISITGESFSAESIRKKVSVMNPDFILLPNYSKASSMVMAAFNGEKNPPLFVGGDGWGDSQYGFVQNGMDVENVKGITVRGFPSVAKGLEQFPLGRRVRKKTLSFVPDLSIIKILDVTVDTLCKKHPKDKLSYFSAFDKIQSKKMISPWDVSLFELRKGEIHFVKMIGKNL